MREIISCIILSLAVMMASVRANSQVNPDNMGRISILSDTTKAHVILLKDTLFHISSRLNDDEKALAWRIYHDSGLDRAREVARAAADARAAGDAAAARYAGGYQNVQDDDASNAVQHAVGVCAMAVDPRIGPDLAKSLTDAHETGDQRSSALKREFDQRNNAVGLAIGATLGDARQCEAAVLWSLETSLS